MKFFRSKKVKVIAMLLVVAIIGGVVYNTGVTKKSKASEINGNQISISEEIDYSMIDENIKDIDVTNNVDGSVEAVVYYVDGTREVAVADKVNNTVKTEVYNKDNTLKTCEVTNLDLGECVATELNEQDTLNEDDEASVKRNNSEITRGKKKLPAPKEKGNKLIWKLNANQVQVFIAMCNAAGALATLVAAVAAAIAFFTGNPIAGKIAVWAGIIAGAFYCTAAFTDLVVKSKGGGSITATINKDTKKVKLA